MDSQIAWFCVQRKQDLKLLQNNTRRNMRMVLLNNTKVSIDKALSETVSTSPITTLNGDNTCIYFETAHVEL